MKICIACSAGGHLTEVQQLRAAYENHDRFFLTFRRIDSAYLARTEKVHFITDPKRNPLALLAAAVASFIVFMRERPKVVLTTGAGVAVPVCAIAKLFGRKVIYVESFCRVVQPSITGRLLYPVADLFIVQWREMLRRFPKAAYGTLF
ncbi:MAG: hypothetical protein HY519_04370 [Candidatus Aenigmarchaeota archaeon]|nr:hypothetical protein [Candidatus Aenigmarchaeota archaeon]